MVKRIRGRLSYANVVATLALIIAVGGASALAATQLAANSVGTKQLKKSAVTTAKIKNRAVTGAKIKLSSLRTVPTASHASTADIAGAISPPEPIHYVGTAGAPAFENGFTNYGVGTGAVGFYKDRECVVHLLGTAHGVSGQAAFRLPAADAPPQEVFAAIAVAGLEAGNLLVSPAGVVVPAAAGGGLSIFGLDGVTFRAASC